MANEDHSCYSALFIIIMSHGEEGGVIFTHDCKPIQISSIASHFTISKCPSLAGKPKVLIMQACQGEEVSKAIPNPQCSSATLQKDGSGSPFILIDPNSTVDEADFLFAFSTLPGRSAIRDMENGSWYIQELIKTLKSYSCDSFTNILDEVNNQLTHYKLMDKNISQICSYQSTLCKQLHIGKAWNRSLRYVNNYNYIGKPSNHYSLFSLLLQPWCCEFNQKIEWHKKFATYT